MHPRYSSNEHVHKMFPFEGILFQEKFQVSYAL